LRGQARIGEKVVRARIAAKSRSGEENERTRNEMDLLSYQVQRFFTRKEYPFADIAALFVV
jgi:hypothetical protein